MNQLFEVTLAHALTRWPVLKQCRKTQTTKPFLSGPIHPGLAGHLWFPKGLNWEGILPLEGPELAYPAPILNPAVWRLFVTILNSQGDDSTHLGIGLIIVNHQLTKVIDS